MHKILLITTGGTIACPDTNKARSPQDFSKTFPHSFCEHETQDIEIVEPFCLDSTNMTPRHYIELAKIITKNYGGFGGFVITHGTDTLAYAAAVLSCLIENSEKPVVLTGSMKPFMAKNSDAPENLHNALLFASDNHAHGVSVVFGKYAFDGRCVSKVHTTAINAFESVNFPPLALLERERVVFTEPKAEYSGTVRFYETLDERIETVFLVPGISAPIIRNETRAVIILGFGTGGLPVYLEGFLKELVSRGIYIIMSTQVLRGGSNLSLYEVGSGIMDRYPVIDAGKMTVEYASMRAMFALSISDSFEEFRRIFSNE